MAISVSVFIIFSIFITLFLNLFVTSATIFFGLFFLSFFSDRLPFVCVLVFFLFACFEKKKYKKKQTKKHAAWQHPLAYELLQFRRYDGTRIFNAIIKTNISAFANILKQHKLKILNFKFQTNKQNKYR